MSRYCRIRWEHAEKQRYYEALLSQDLLGDWCLQKIWGRKNSALGQVRQSIVTNFDAGWQVIVITAKRRRSHGYVITLQRGIDASLSEAIE